MKKAVILSVIFFQSFINFSCTNDDDSNQIEIEGTWQLLRFDDSVDGTVLAPNDDKPVWIAFKADGNFEGKAGNNKIQGEYETENGKLIFTMSSSEIVRTDWELMFIQSINRSLDEGKYIMDYDLQEGELSLEYEAQSKMFFMKM